MEKKPQKNRPKNRFNASWLHDHINDPYVKMAQRDGYRARAAYKLKEIDEQDRLIRPGQVIVDLGAAPGSWSQYARNRLAAGAKRAPGVSGIPDAPSGASARRDGRDARGALGVSDAPSGALGVPGASGMLGASDMSGALGASRTSGASGTPAAPGAVREGGIDGTIIALDLLPMEPIADVHFILGDFREESVLAQLEKTIGARRVDLVISDMAPNLSGVASADAARIEHVCDLALEFAQRHLTPEGALLVKCFHGSGYSQIVERFKQQFRIVAARKPKASRDKSAETFILGRRLKQPAQAVQTLAGGPG